MAEFAPLEMYFTRQSVLSDFDLQPAAQIIVDEPFTSNTGQFSTFTEGTQSNFTLSGGLAVLSNGGSGDRNVYVRTGPDIGIPNAFVSVEINSRSGSGGTYDNISVGIAKNASNFLFAQYDRIGQDVRVQGKVGGTNGFRMGIGSTVLTAPFKLGLGIHGVTYSFWTDTGSGWVFRGAETLGWVGNHDIRTVDWSGWKAAIGHASNNSSLTWNLDNLKFGRFGAVGLRDFTPITDESGRVVDYGGKVRLLATASAPGADVRASFATVVEFDPSALTLEQIGTLAISRDGGQWNDHGGHLIKLNSGNYRLLTSTWGNGFNSTLQVRSVETTTDISSGSHLVTGTSQLSLPNIPVSPGIGGAYDPYAVKYGGTWYLAYSVVNPTSFAGENFYTALATTSDFSTFTAVGADSSRKIVEGPRLVPTNSDLWVVTGGRGRQVVYDETLTYQGDSIPKDVAFYNGTDTQPWPSMFAWDDQVFMVTWDNTKFSSQTFTWGDVWIYTSPRYDVVPVDGDLSVTEDDDALAANGVIAIVGALAATEADDLLDAGGSVPVSAALSVTDDDDALAAYGQSGAGVVGGLGDLFITEDDDTLDGVATVEISGVLDAMEDGDVLLAFAISGSNGPFVRRPLIRIN